MSVITIKKYSNRRLYDTDESRYITLDELAEKIQAGADVRVVDAKAGTDLTQQILTQIIIESRGAAALLPVPLLTQLVRMGDDALAEFFGQYMAGALEVYVQARRAARRAAELNPFLPGVHAENPFARLLQAIPFPGRRGGWGARGMPHGAPPSSPRDLYPEVVPDDEPVPDTDSPERAGFATGRPDAPPPSDPASDIAELRRELAALKEALRSKADS